MAGRPIARSAVVALTAAIAGCCMIGSATAQSGQPVIVSVELIGVVDPFTADHVAGVVHDAQASGAEAVLLTIDTPGGLGSSMDEIDQALLNSTIPVIGYVAPSGARAASAGAFVLLSCPVAAMAPGTNVGASTPIGLSGGDLARKVRNDAQAKIRGIAQIYGRNEQVVESFVVDATSITAEEALAAGVIDLIAPSTEDLLQQLDGEQVLLGTGSTVTLHTAGATIREEPMGAFVGFLHQLLDPNLAFIFFWLGLGLIVLELIVPGHIFSGTIGTLMLIAALVSFGVLPVRIIGIALLVLSVIAFVVELKAPGIGIWGGVGVVSLLLGGWFLYDRSAGVQVSTPVLVGVAVFAGLFFGVIVAAALRMRHTPSMLEGRTIVGAEGVALPAGVGPTGGVVRVASEEWKAVAPAGIISGGAKIRVTALDGLMLTVEPIDLEHTQAGAPNPAIEGGNDT